MVAAAGRQNLKLRARNITWWTRPPQDSLKCDWVSRRLAESETRDPSDNVIASRMNEYKAMLVVAFDA
jgi:hypothetical protein